MLLARHVPARITVLPAGIVTSSFAVGKVLPGQTLASFQFPDLVGWMAAKLTDGAQSMDEVTLVGILVYGSFKAKTVLLRTVLTTKVKINKLI